METASPRASSGSASHQEVSSSDDLPIQRSLLLSDGLMALRNMRSQLYSAAEYFELSYINDDRKEIVMRTLKDYAVEAVVNAVDHLGSVSYKVNNLLNEEVDDVSVAESEVSCIEQTSHSKLRRTPSTYGERQTTAASERNAHSSSPSPCPPLVREDSSSPSRNSRPASPLPQLEKISSKGKRDNSPLRASNPLTRARSAANRPPIPNSSKQCLLESQNSLPNCLHDERYNRKETERNPTKKKGFLKSLLMRNRSWTDESLYSYLDEY
ncbi:hypothetical protein MUK42_33091 [Musa troglodytarum]|uniref:Uncharacterized protein n=1 Tax=Musa troglodytarum TaxID=320322 RepID=A0A9E7IJV3_9LILI|nr:hypothetical protein MUK42_33091 [Musa troglodytarum]